MSEEREFLNSLYSLDGGLDPGVKIKIKTKDGKTKIIDLSKVHNTAVQQGGVVVDGLYFKLEDIESVTRVEDASNTKQPPKLLDHLGELLSYFMPRRQR